MQQVQSVSGANRRRPSEAEQSDRLSSIKIESGQFVDRSGRPLYQGAPIRYHTYGGSILNATVQADHMLGRMLDILINGDPYSVYADHRQLQLAEGARDMPTATEKTAKELRREAKNLGVQGYMDMDRAELEAAIDASKTGDTAGEQRTEAAPAKKVKKVAKVAKSTAPPADEEEDEQLEEAPAKKAKKSKKAPPAKKATKKAATAPKVSDGPNPFRAGTNLYHITEALIRGGKRSKLVDKLVPKLEYNPRTKGADFDPRVETDRRLKVVGYLLKNKYGFEYKHDGRGEDATIKVIPPEAS